MLAHLNGCVLHVGTTLASFDAQSTCQSLVKVQSVCNPLKQMYANNAPHSSKCGISLSAILILATSNDDRHFLDGPIARFTGLLR